MKTWIAILFSLGLLATCIVIYEMIGFDLTWIMVLGTALWAAFDSTKIKLRRYKSGISYGPVVLFIACALLWIVGFPWYLAMRYKIQTGTAIVKPEFVQPSAPPNDGPATRLGDSGFTEGPPSVS
jgi:hypothetical protein